MTTYGMTVLASGEGPERFRRGAALAAAAEEAGFDSVWTSELYNRSATVPMAVYALATERVRIGSNIAYGVGRSPLMWAAEARDLDDLSGGRLTLGLGNGTATMMRDWHGVSGEAPAVRMEELVEVLRKLWRLHEGPVEHEGRFYHLDLKPTSDSAPPLQERLPIWIAGINPLMMRVVGRVADGLVGHPMFTRKYVHEVVEPELTGATEAAGRSRSDVARMGILMCAVDDDEQVARDRVAFAIGQYAASRVYDRLFALHGWSQAQDTIRAAARAGDGQALISAVPDEAVDAIAVACRPDELVSRVAQHAGEYDHLALVAPAWGLTPPQLEAATLQIVDAFRAQRSSLSPPG
ncbi:MAG: flavin-dependent oxidoreductase, F420-dependent methylene-tetrahydromethanopterin reductase [Frankiales bacterium]|jgi:probable F420-dependent oxidoreductase|nr:flavin-dependent oxidoreductase, F420-dependent methylene-tetrahydromethanopterin reductase [Frankiales bacterium]